MEKYPHSSPEAQGAQPHESAGGERDPEVLREQNVSEALAALNKLETGGISAKELRNAEADVEGSLTAMHFRDDKEGLDQVHSAIEQKMLEVVRNGGDPRTEMPIGYGVWESTTSTDRQDAFLSGRKYSPGASTSTEAPRVAAPSATTSARRRPYSPPDLEDTQPFATVAPGNTRKQPYSTGAAADDATGPIPRVTAEPYEALKARMAAQTAAATAPESSPNTDDDEEAKPYQRHTPEDVKVWGNEDLARVAQERFEQAPNFVGSVNPQITTEAVRLAHEVEKYYHTDPKYVEKLVEEVEEQIDQAPDEGKRIAWIAAFNLMEETVRKMEQGAAKGRHSKEAPESPQAEAEKFLAGVNPRFEKKMMRDHIRAFYDEKPEYVAEMVKAIEKRHQAETDPELKDEWLEMLRRAEDAVDEVKAANAKSKEAAEKTPEDKPKKEEEKISASIRAQFKVLEGLEWVKKKVHRYRLGKVALAAAGIGVAFYGARQGWFSDRDIIDNLQGADPSVLPHPVATGGEDAVTSLPEPADITPPATSERVVEEVPVPIPKAAVNIEAGEGFAQTMRELGIKGHTLRDLLNDDELRQKLIDMNVAYLMDDGNIGIALDAGDKMPKGALNAIREAAGMDITHEVVKEIPTPVETVTPQPEVTPEPAATPQPETAVPVTEPNHAEQGLSEEEMKKLWLGGAAVATLVGGVVLGRAYRKMSRPTPGRHRRPEDQDDEEAARSSEGRPEVSDDTAEIRMPLFAEDRREPQIATDILRNHLKNADNPTVQDIYDSYAELASHMEPATAVRAMNQALRNVGLSNHIRFKRDLNSGRVRVTVNSNLSPEALSERFQQVVSV